MNASAGRGGFAKIVTLESVDSTNRFAAKAARDGANEGLVVVADVQRAGRGRRGRTWEAPAGSALLCSVLFRPRPDVAAHLAPSVVALAALDATTEVAGVTLTIKWPNDLLAGASKIAGILGEIVADPIRAPDARERVDAARAPLTWPAVIVGIGLNLAWPDGFAPPATTGPLAGLGAPATTLAEAGGRSTSRDDLLDAFVSHLEHRWEPLRRPGSARAGAKVMADYRARCSTIGAPVRVEYAGGVLDGVARDIRDDGRLELETDSGTVVLDAADVIHLRRGDDAGSITF